MVSLFFRKCLLVVFARVRANAICGYVDLTTSVNCHFLHRLHLHSREALLMLQIARIAIPVILIALNSSNNYHYYTVYFQDATALLVSILQSICHS
ncbi:hypothetical protein C0J52_15247 [Blattella germanica]|nr:hypothetical protein C0J52_15247 [Blattella germanica]